MSTKKTPDEIRRYFQDNGFVKESDGLLRGFNHDKHKEIVGSIYNIDNFLNAGQARQDEILDSTQIVITEEEFYNAKRWLALVYITGGEHFSDGKGGDVNHKSVYQQQGILPSDGTIAISGADIAQKMDSVIPYITADHVKKLYKRLVEKRPKFFVSKDDTTEDARSHGNHTTKNQTVKLEEYISYAEMSCCSSLLQVSGDVNFVNDGNRENLGIKGSEGEYEKQGRIAGLVGARFEIDDAMESTNLIFGVSERLEAEHSTALVGIANQRANFGRINSVNKEFVEGHKKIWDEFYKNQNSTHDTSGLLNDRLQQRLYISYKKFFADAITDAKKNNIKAHIRVVGLGDGAWADGKNIQVGEAIGGAVARILKELSDENKNQIDTIEFCDHGNSNYENGFKGADGDNLKNTIKIENNKEAPFSRKIKEAVASFFGIGAKNIKLYVCFAWDSASYVGNEYWLAPPYYFGASGDPAAAACSSIPISMNPQLNSQFLDKIKVVKSGSCEIVDISDESLKKEATFSKSSEAAIVGASGAGSAGADVLSSAPAPAPAPADGVVVDTEDEKEKQENLKTLQGIYGSNNVVFINSDRNFFIRFRTQQEAEDHSQELFNRVGNYKIVGGGGRKYVNFQYRGDSIIYGSDKSGKTESDKEFFGIILTPDNVKKIQEKHEKDLSDFQKREDKKRELLQALEGKGLKIRPSQKINGELEFFVTLQDVLGGDNAQEVKTILEAKMASFSIKGAGKGNKVLVPLNADGKIIYSSTEFIDGDAGRPKYDYSSPSIRKFAIILTQENAEELLKLNDDQINLLKMEAKTDTEFLPPRVQVADPEKHQENLVTIKKNCGTEDVIPIKGGGNFFIRFDSRSKAEYCSKELKKNFIIQEAFYGGKKFINFSYRGNALIIGEHEHSKSDEDVEFFGIILTPDDIKLFQIEVAPAPPAHAAAPPAQAPAPRAAVPPPPAHAAAPPAPAPAHAPAPPADAPAQNEGESFNQKIIGVAVGGAIGVGGVLLCASALGVGIVSAPVIGTAIVVGGAGILVGSIVAKPIADSIASCLSKRSNSPQV